MVDGTWIPAALVALLSAPSPSSWDGVLTQARMQVEAPSSQELPPPLILKPTDTGLITASHRSHSSHRSHYSGTGGGSYSPSPAAPSVPTSAPSTTPAPPSPVRSVTLISPVAVTGGATLWRELEQASDLRHFRRACELAGLMGKLKDPNSRFTLLAFTDSAFLSAASKHPELIGARSDALLSALAQSLVAFSSVEPEMVVPGMVLKMADGSTVQLQKSGLIVSAMGVPVYRVKTYTSGTIYSFQDVLGLASHLKTGTVP